MANVLNPETESITLNTELETPTLDPATELEPLPSIDQPSPESTSNLSTSNIDNSAVVSASPLDADALTEPVAQAATLELPTPTETPAAPAAVVETPEPVVKTPAPVVETPAPVVETPAPVAETPAPVAVTPAPVVETPAPVAVTPAPVVETPAPLAPAPAVATHAAEPAHAPEPPAATVAPPAALSAPSHSAESATPAVAPRAATTTEPADDFSQALAAFEREQAAEAAAVEAYGDKIVSGKVEKQTEKYLVVDVGLKSEGLVPLEQVVDHTGTVKFQPGDIIDVVIEREEAEGGYLVSYERAQRLRVWDTIEKAANDKTPITGTVVSRVKGGLTVDIGMKAFLPGSQLEIRPVRNLDTYLG